MLRVELGGPRGAAAARRPVDRGAAVRARRLLCEQHRERTRFGVLGHHQRVARLLELGERELQEARDLGGVRVAKGDAVLVRAAVVAPDGVVHGGGGAQVDDRGRGVRRRELEAEDAEVVQGVGLALDVADLALDGEPRLVRRLRLVVLAELPVDDAEVAQGIALVQRVADLARDDERRLVRRLRLVVLAEALVDDAEVAQGLPSPRLSPISRRMTSPASYDAFALSYWPHFENRRCRGLLRAYCPRICLSPMLRLRDDERRLVRAFGFVVLAPGSSRRRSRGCPA